MPGWNPKVRMREKGKERSGHHSCRMLALIRLEGVTGSLGQTVFPNASPGIDGGAKPFALHQIPYLPLGTKRLWLERTWRRKKVWSNFF